MSKKTAEKKRERAARIKLQMQKRRAAHDKQKKEERQQFFASKQANKIEPIMSQEKKDEYLKRKLEKNMQILQALEEEYLLEQKNREQLNENLEAQGCLTLDEKLQKISSEK